MNDAVTLPADPNDTVVKRPKPVTIYPLQYLRAFAAYAVVLCHASFYVMQTRGEGTMWQLFARAGGFGVILFFAISGFLMAELASNTPPLKFLAHRLIRIYPIYWLCVFSVVAFSHLGSSPIHPDLLSLLLVPGGTRAYVLGVEWTLPFELTFYLIVFAIITMKLQRRLPLIALAWVALIELFVRSRPELQQGQFPQLLNLPLSQFSLAFAAGLLVPSMVRRGLVGPATPLLAVAMIACNEALIPVSPMLSSALMGLGCVLLVASAVNAGKNGTDRPRYFLAALGDWSYALYLIHVPVIRALCALLPASVPTMTLWVAAISVPIPVAILFGKIDLRMYKILKKRVDASAPRLRLALALVFLIVVFVVSTISYARIWQARAATSDVASLASKIEAGLGGDLSRLPAAAEAAKLQRDDGLKGYFDEASLSAEGLRVQGWAADTMAARRSVRVLVFYCGRYSGVAVQQEGRADVAAILHADNVSLGFNRALPLPTRCDDHTVYGLLVGSDNRYTIVKGTAH
jgi:exopolysaccharide production protein ExoZ